jgi:DNA polymerase I-like protein with 3'-5' exonuclease and polymerase domains
MSSVNLLALPKRVDFLKNFIAPKGYILCREDINSLEPCVLTYLCQDKNLLKLYGKDAKPHDGYLFVAYHIFQSVKDVYDIDDMTVEKRKKAKELCHTERDYIKPVFLGWFYGLGPTTLSLQKNMPIKEATRLLNKLDYIFQGKQRLHEALMKQYKETGGHVVSARGTPVCVCKGKTKDIVNRVVQKSGHELLQRLLYLRNQYRLQHNIRMYPYIPDWHDESIWFVHPDDVEKAKEAIEYSYRKLNEELGWNVEIKHGGIKFGYDVSIRCD